MRKVDQRQRHARPISHGSSCEKLTDEAVKVDEMILETDVDETHCPQQLVDVPVPQIAQRIVEVVTAFHGSESQERVVAQIVNMVLTTHTKWWRRSSKIFNLTQQVANAQDAKIVSQSNSEQVNKV